MNLSIVPAPPADPGQAAPARADLPERLRLAPGRTVVWRSPGCMQLGLDPHRAMVIDDLPGPLAALLRGMDGLRSTSELLAEAEAAGSPPGDGRGLLVELYRSGLVQDASAPDEGPPGWHRAALATEAVHWSVHTSYGPREVLRRRRSAAVRVVGSGRVAVALATALAAAGVGQLAVAAEGTVEASDLGTGYLPDDLGRPRASAAADAVRRAAPDARVHDRYLPDLVVLTDVLVPEPELVTELVAARVAHLIVSPAEGRVTVGPLVWPGRSSCLRCAELHRADADRAWPKLAAQLAGRVPPSGLAAALLAAALAAEQVLAALAGADAGLPRPPIWGAALELDPVSGTLRRQLRPAHPRCGCGAG